MAEFIATKELRTREADQLRKLLAERQEQFRHLRFQISSKEVKNHRESRYLRREIARIQTIIAEKSTPVLNVTTK